MNYCSYAFWQGKDYFRCAGDTYLERKECEYYCQSENEFNSLPYSSSCRHFTYREGYKCSCQEAQREIIKQIKQHLEEKFEEFPC